MRPAWLPGLACCRYVPTCSNVVADESADRDAVLHAHAVPVAVAPPGRDAVGRNLHVMTCLSPTSVRGAGQEAVSLAVSSVVIRVLYEYEYTADAARPVSCTCISMQPSTLAMPLISPESIDSLTPPISPVRERVIRAAEAAGSGCDDGRYQAVGPNACRGLPHARALQRLWGNWPSLPLALGWLVPGARSGRNTRPHGPEPPLHTSLGNHNNKQ